MFGWFAYIYILLKFCFVPWYYYMICSFFMLSQGIKKNFQLSYFAFLIISYPAHCFTFGIVFYMCVGYKVGRQILQCYTKYSLSLFLIEHYCVLLNSIMRVQVGLCNVVFVIKLPKGEIVRTLSLVVVFEIFIFFYVWPYKSF